MLPRDISNIIYSYSNDSDRSIIAVWNVRKDPNYGVVVYVEFSDGDVGEIMKHELHYYKDGVEQWNFYIDHARRIAMNQSWEVWKDLVSDPDLSLM